MTPAKSRRKFLFKVALLVDGAVGAVLAVPILGYLLGPSLKKGSSYNSWVSLGAVSEFPEGETRLVDYRNPVTAPWDGQSGNVACWVRRISGEHFQIFAINCAHLDCPVRWFAQSKLFLCPCHGGAYYADGSRASGPPPRGLFEYQHKITGGQLMISAGEMPTLATEACAGQPAHPTSDRNGAYQALMMSKPKQPGIGVYNWLEAALDWRSPSSKPPSIRYPPAAQAGVRFRQRCDGPFGVASHHRHSPRAGLRALGQPKPGTACSSSDHYITLGWFRGPCMAGARTS